MKRTFLSLVCYLVALISWAQAPNFFDFQSLIRDEAGKFVTNKTIGVRISLLQGAINGEAVYTETHTQSTNANGLLTLTIGGGTTSSNMSTIDWGQGPYFIKTEMDLKGGTNYTLSNTTQMMSVPYALYANETKKIPQEYEDRIKSVEDKVSPKSIGAFSVSGSTQVKFASGNLKYNYTTKKYSFEAHQYDITLPNATSSDLQAIGCLTVANASSTTLCNEFGCTDLDHGILCRKDLQGNWRTLSASEWMYVLNGRKNASNLYALATINNKNGLILLPDIWAVPEGISMKVGKNSSWTNNIFTVSQWNKMEANGAIFLPNGYSSCTVTNHSEGRTTYYTYHYTNNSAMLYQTSSTCVKDRSTRSICVTLSFDNVPTLTSGDYLYEGEISGAHPGNFLPVRVVEDL